MSPRPMLVYGGWVIRQVPGHRNQVRAVVATTTKKAAMEALGVTRGHFADFFSDTSHELDVEAAMSSPGDVFWMPMDLKFTDRRFIPWGQDWKDDPRTTDPDAVNRGYERRAKELKGQGNG